MSDKAQIVEGWTETRGDVVREVWRVPIDGQMKTVVTSSSSLTVMDQAVAIYSKALKRLADR
jgi:hypothetical protein